MKTFIDFRSDASTSPTPEMRWAMSEAEVGNADFGEDPTVARLERAVADLLGKEAAVFVHSGTMANLAAVMSHVGPGETVLVGKHFHVYDFEGPAMERVAGCRFQTLDDATEGGRTRLIHERAILGELQQPSRPRLLSLENTVSRLGGTLIEPSHLEELTAWARSHGMGVHLDGARLLNAAVALGVEPAAMARFADTVSIAFTKAVGAPAGAAVAGSRETAERLRRHRWMLGGNWKQGGIFAAACLEGLQTVNERIAVDHVNARRLAEGLSAVEGCRVDLDRVMTNIVFWEVVNPSVDVERLRTALQKRGILFGRWKPGTSAGSSRSRLVTHHDITADDVELFLETVSATFETRG